MRTEFKDWRVEAQLEKREIDDFFFRGSITARGQDLPNQAKISVRINERSRGRIHPLVAEEIAEMEKPQPLAVIGVDCDIIVYVPEVYARDIRIGGVRVPLSNLRFEDPEVKGDFEKKYPDAEIRIAWSQPA